MKSKLKINLQNLSKTQSDIPLHAQSQAKLKLRLKKTDNSIAGMPSKKLSVKTVSNEDITPKPSVSTNLLSTFSLGQAKKKIIKGRRLIIGVDDKLNK